MLRPLVVAAALATCACASRDSPLRPGASDAGDAASDGAAEVEVDAGKLVPPGAADALANNHRAFCKAFAACFPAHLANLFGDEEGCVSRRLAGSLAALFGPGSSLTTADIEACGRATGESYTCDRILELFYENPVLPADCRLRGALPNGTPCAGSDQCKSGFCKYPTGAACGACADRSPPGGSCTTHVHCAEGFACDASKCVPFVDRGGACGDGEPCHVADACVDGTCVERKPIGAACDVATQDCALSATCNTSSLKCEAVRGGKLGAPCGRLVDGGLGICDAGLRCKITDLGSYAGACVGVATAGETCFRTGPTGSQCEVPLTCASAKCVLPSTDACR